MFRAGQVLFGKLRPYLKIFARPDFDGVCSSEIWVLQGRKEVCHNKFLFYFVQSDRFTSGANVTSGTKLPRSDWNYTSEAVFGIPSLDEQQKIAKILSIWDEAIAKTEQLITVLQARKKGLMQRLLTGEIRFPEFRGEWQEYKIGKIANLTVGGLRVLGS